MACAQLNKFQMIQMRLLAMHVMSYFYHQMKTPLNTKILVGIFSGPLKAVIHSEHFVFCKKAKTKLKMILT